MQEIFRLVVSSFKDLSDMSSRSYSKRVSILDNVARVRSPVVMLDLECDSLIVEMFYNFLGSIRYLLFQTKILDFKSYILNQTSLYIFQVICCSAVFDEFVVFFLFFLDDKILI